MNTIKAKIDFKNGIAYQTGIELIEDDYNSTKIIFEFDDKEKSKILYVKNSKDELVYSGVIENNEVVLVGKKEDGTLYSLFSEIGTYTYEVTMYDTNSKLTSKPMYFDVRKRYVQIDDDVVEAYLPVFDELMNEITTLEENIESAETTRQSNTTRNRPRLY